MSERASGHLKRPLPCSPESKSLMNFLPWLAQWPRRSIQPFSQSKSLFRLTCQVFLLILGGVVGDSQSHANETTDGKLPREVIDLPLLPAPIDLAPGRKYSDELRDYAMVIGFDRTPKGRLWAAWVAGGDSEKGYFVAASSDDHGETWSRPRLVIDPADLPSGLHHRTLVGNFWTDPLGRLWLFYDQSLGYFDGRAGVWAIRCDNPDSDLPQWTKPVRIWHGSTLNKPIVLSNGDWLLPISLWKRDKIRPVELQDYHHDLDDQRMVYVFVSTDQGESWSRRGGVFIPDGQFDEHMMVELRDGRIWLLARTTCGALAESFSSDCGRTWTKAKPSAIKHINARFHIRRLASGRLLLVKHGWIEERTEVRSHARAFLSDDDGKT